MKHVVLEHHLDGDLYHVLIGFYDTVEMGVFDEDGNPVMLDDEPVMVQDMEEVPYEPEGGWPEGSEGHELGITHVIPKVYKSGKKKGQPVLTQLLGEDGEPMVRPGGQKIEPQEMLIATEDFVFHAEDEKWEGLDIEEIAKRQRVSIKRALNQREKEFEEAQAKSTPPAIMPGMGEEL